MGPAELVAAIRADASDSGAWTALDKLVRELAARSIRAAQERDEVAQRVMFKFAQQCSSETLSIRAESDGEVRRYITLMLRSASIDGHRKTKHDVLVDDMAKTFETLALDEDPLEARGAIERLDALAELVFEAVISELAEGHRAGRAQARREVHALFLEEATLEGLLRASGQLDGLSDPEVKKALNRAMKQHERYRASMIECAQSLCAAGKISRDEAAIIERVMQTIRRR